MSSVLMSSEARSGTAATVRGSGWLRRDLRAAPAAVWALVVLNLLLMLTWTTLQPAYRGLDEAAHIDMVVDLPNPFSWPAPGEKIIDDRIKSTFPEAGHDGLPFARLPAEDALPRDARPSFAEADPSGLGPAVNQMVQHPPLYYVYAATGMLLVPDGWAFDLQIAAMRILTLLLAVPLPLLCWLAARRLRLPTAAGVTAAVVPLTVPGLTRVSASVSNDALLTLAVGVATVLALAVAGGDLRRRTAVALGVTAVVGMYAKGLGLVLPPLIVAAYVVAVLRGGSGRDARREGLLSLGIAAVVGGTWYVRNLVVAGAVQPNGYAGGGLPYPRAQGGGLGEWFPDYAERMAFRFWSALGQPEPPELPEELTYWLSGVTVALSVLALLLASRRRLLVGTALLPLAGLLTLVAYGSYSNYQLYDRYIGVQGRYLYPAVVGLAAVVAVAFDRVFGPLRRVVPVLLLGVACWVQWLATEAVLEAYWTPDEAPEALRNGLDTLETWAPFDELVTRGFFVLTVVALAVTVGATVDATTRRHRAPAE